MEEDKTWTEINLMEIGANSIKKDLSGSRQVATVFSFFFFLFIFFF